MGSASLCCESSASQSVAVFNLRFMSGCRQGAKKRATLQCTALYREARTRLPSGHKDERASGEA